MRSPSSFAVVPLEGLLPAEEDRQAPLDPFLQGVLIAGTELFHEFLPGQAPVD